MLYKAIPRDKLRNDHQLVILYKGQDLQMVLSLITAKRKERHSFGAVFVIREYLAFLRPSRSSFTL